MAINNLDFLRVPHKTRVLFHDDLDSRVLLDALMKCFNVFGNNFLMLLLVVVNIAQQRVRLQDF
jgi:hypothetical protein